MSHGIAQQRRSAVRARPRAAGLTHEDFVEYAQRLQKLAAKVEQFLGEQCARLDEATRGLAQAASAGSNPRSLAQDFERQRAAWELERSAELRQIEEQRNLLSEAWSRLESEQRRLLVQRNSLRLESAMGGTARRDEVSSAPVAATSPADSAQLRVGESGGATLTEQDRRAVMMQFQQMKSDVRKYAQRRNRKR
jgi:hypothetical protein